MIPLKVIPIWWYMTEMPAESRAYKFGSHYRHWLCADFEYVTHGIQNPKAKLQIPYWHHIFFLSHHMDVCCKGRCRCWHYDLQGRYFLFFARHAMCSVNTCMNSVPMTVTVLFFILFIVIIVVLYQQLMIFMGNCRHTNVATSECDNICAN